MYSKFSYFSEFHKKKPIGNLPLTLSKVLAGTIKIFSSFARNSFLKSEKFGACRIFKVENSASFEPKISLFILMKN